MFKCLGGSSLNGNFMMQNFLNQQQMNARNSNLDDNNSFTSGDKIQRNPLDDLGGAGSIESRSNKSNFKHTKNSFSGDFDQQGFKHFNLNLNQINSPGINERLNSS